MPPEAPRRRGLARGIERLATGWALAGGALILGLVALNTWSVLADALAGRGFAGTVELTEVGVAVAVFAFLPYCQMTGANPTVDVFTARAGHRLVAWLGTAAAAIALGVALVLLARMALGLGDQRAAHLTTTIVQFPIWTAYVPILISLGLLILAAAVMLVETAAATRG